jgi:hypothetical protein
LHALNHDKTNKYRFKISSLFPYAVTHLSKTLSRRKKKTKTLQNGADEKELLNVTIAENITLQIFSKE